ncbi:MAG: hypothetical protein JXQ66_04420 [Campylobacterales bacterium]|nr:hypothetical protein [Campylobacterales bacterium]
MGEPRLEDIEDYDTLKGGKKKIVYGVILVGLILGVIYTVAYNDNKNVDDSIKVEDSVKNIPLK